MIPAAAYYRMSTDEQSESIPGQRSAVEPFAKKHGYRIVQNYADEGISGDATEKRMAFKQMIEDAKAGKFKAILCWDQDRFGRFDSLEAGYWIHPLRLAGIRLVTINDGPINWDDFTGRVMYSLKQEGKHQYLHDLSRNVLRNMAQRAADGKWVAGSPPLGYAVGPDQRLVLGAPHDIATVRTIFDGYLAGHSLRTLAEMLAAKGCRTARGKAFEYVGVRAVLKNPNYTGDLHWNVRSESKYGSVRNGASGAPPLADGIYHDQADWIVVPGAHPAIVTREEYDTVQSRLESRRVAASTPVKGGGRFVLSGLLRCGKCGSAMTGNTYSGLAYYVCCGYFHRGASFCLRNSVRQEELLERVIETIEDPESLERMRQRIRRQAKASTTKASLDGLESRLAEARRELETASRNMALASNEFLRRQCEKIVTELAEREQLLAASLDAAAGPGRQAASAEARIDEAVARLKSLRTTLEAADTMRLREFLRLAIARIKVYVRQEARAKRNRFFLAGGEIELRTLDLFAGPRSCKQVLRWGKTG